MTSNRNTSSETINNDHNFDLKLFGDKIKLEVKPVSKDSTASSRCALLARGISRPMSAVPALSLYRKDNDNYEVKTKRPYSADSLQPKINEIKRLQFITNFSSTSDSSVTDDKGLPSTQLLRDLLSEPVQTSPMESKDQNLSSEESMDDDNFEDTNAEFGRTCLLTPGLTTKPPLPKKVEPRLDKNTEDKIDDEIEVIRLKSLQFEKDFNEAVEDAFAKSKNIMTDKEFDSFLVNTKYDLEQQILEDFLGKNEEINQKNTYSSLSERQEMNQPEEMVTSKSDTQLNNYNREKSDVEKSEKKTDGFLKKLKIKHDQIDKCINKAQTVLDKTLDKKNNNFNKKRNDHKDKKEKMNNTIDFKKPKGVFQAIPVTTYREHQDLTPAPEETWMEKEFRNQPFGSPKYNSTTIREAKGMDSQTKVDNWLQNDTNPSKTSKTNFLDILDKVEALEVATRVDKTDLPEHDVEPKEDASDGNTYDDIVQILEVLEAEDRKSHMNIESMRVIVKEEVKGKHDKHPVPIIKVTSASRASSATSNCSDQGLGSTASLNSCASNYNEILSYLDEVDRNCTKSLVSAKERVQKVTKALEGAIRLDTIPRKEDLRSLNTDELIDQVVDLHIRVKDKSSSIKLLQDELSSLRDQVLKITRQTEDIVKQKLKTQKEEHEGIVKRHQKFIDQLIADKKALNQQCEGLINEMKLLEDRFTSNMKAAEHRHQVELRKTKEMQQAGEKIRRERWIEGKTQKIKELTVKSIEPELQSMTLRHQQEISDLRALHKKELEELEVKAARKTQQQLEALREQLREEMEKAVQLERDIANQRYEKMVENEEKNYQEQRRRLQQDHAKRVMQCEDREAAALAEKERAIKLAQEDFEEKLQAISRRHNNELKVLKETTDLEVEAWKNNYRKQQAGQLVEKETRMREQFKKERDRDIEEVIDRLEAEAAEARQQIEQTAETRIRRMRTKFDNEIAELEQSEREAKNRYAEVKAKLLEGEDVIINLRANVKQLEGQLANSQNIAETLSAEKSNMKDIVRLEMKDEVRSLEHELRRLKEDKDKELQQVYSRVKLAIAKKDEVLSELSRDHTALQEKCVYLENMLEQQRKEYLIK